MTRSAVSLAPLLMSWAAAAHHSVGAFYVSDASSEISGKITSVDWVNPHIRFTIEAIGENDSPKLWEVESGSVNMLERNGIGRDRLLVGNEVTVVGRLSRLGQNAMYAASIRTSAGETVVLRGLFGEAEAAASALLDPQPATLEDIFRVWTHGRAYGEDADDSPTGLALPYTPQALAARARYDPLTDDTALRCIPQGMPGIMDNPFPVELVQRGNGDIVIRMEEWDVVRTIHMSGDGNAEARPATPQGYSVGRWVGQTLEVRTTRINWPFFDDVGTPQSADIEILERFSLSADRTRLNYAITATDPETFTEPVTLEGYWVWVPGQEIKPYNCTL